MLRKWIPRIILFVCLLSFQSICLLNTSSVYNTLIVQTRYPEMQNEPKLTMIEPSEQINFIRKRVMNPNLTIVPSDNIKHDLVGRLINPNQTIIPSEKQVKIKHGFRRRRVKVMNPTGECIANTSPPNVKIGKLGQNWNAPGFRKILLWSEKFGNKKKNLWNKVLQRILKGQCLNCNCAFSTNHKFLNESDAVLFQSENLLDSNFRNIPKTRKPNQLWIFLGYETFFQSMGKGVTGLAFKKNKFKVPYRTLKGVFNLTMSYRLDSDIVARHGITHRIDEHGQGDLLDQRPFPSFDSKRSVHFNGNTTAKNASIAWFVSHCPTNNAREKYVLLLRKHMKVDIYGTCGKLSCGKMRRLKNPTNLWDDPCFEMVNRKYRFLVAFENALCKDYVTEKVYNALLHNTIPLVLTGTFDREKFLPPHSVINVGQFDNPEHLSEYLQYLLNNQTAYMEYFAWRSTHSVTSFFSVPDTCPLCTKINELVETGDRAVVEDFRQWYQTDAECTMPRKRMKLTEWYQDWTAMEVEQNPIIEEWKQRAKKYSENIIT